jgi:hypothetical protein
MHFCMKNQAGLALPRKLQNPPGAVRRPLLEKSGGDGVLVLVHLCSFLQQPLVTEPGRWPAEKVETGHRC